MNNYRKGIIFYVLGAIILGFIILTVFVLVFPESFIDLEFSEEVQEHQSPVLDQLMKIISWLGYRPYSIIMVVSASLAFFFFKFRKEALYTLFTLVSGLVSYSVKIAVNRARPSAPLVRIVDEIGDQSFPSGHVLFYVVFFGFMIVLMYKLKSIPDKLRLTVAVISLGLIFSVPFSRVYLGAHWFTDVLGAFLLGIICLYGLSFLYLRKPD